MTTSDERHMARALELARSAPFASPNPRVGCVVVRGGEVIAEGVHRGPGTLHAEAEALGRADARGATMYVNLEPCAHYGRTPPCAPAIADAGVARVVAAIEDPHQFVNGKGFALLLDAGVQVDVGVRSAEAEALNAPFLHHARTGRSFLSLKLALTLDGRLAAPDGSAGWITGSAARRRVHQRRLECDAVMVGTGTVLADDPSLTVRAVDAPRQPARVIVDARGRVPPEARVFADDATVIVATTDLAPHDVVTAWKETGAEVLVLPESGEGVDLDALMGALGTRGLVEVFCEGGAALAASLLAGGLVDRLEIHHGPLVLGGGPSIELAGELSLDAATRFDLVGVEQLGDDLLTTYVKAEG